MSKNINTDGLNILPPAYITKLPRHLAGIIFKTRSYMLKIRKKHENDKPRSFLQMVQTIPGDTRTYNNRMHYDTRHRHRP